MTTEHKVCSLLDGHKVVFDDEHEAVEITQRFRVSGFDMSNYELDVKLRWAMLVNQ